jgi:hypothetical protein
VKSAWVPGASIGFAETEVNQLTDSLLKSAGSARLTVGHRGGRLLWHLSDYPSLRLRWFECACSDADTLETQLIECTRPTVTLAHVRVIDGTGHPAVTDENIVTEHGHISRMETPTDDLSGPGAVVLKLRGYTVVAGILLACNHLGFTSANERFSDAVDTGNRIHLGTAGRADFGLLYLQPDSQGPCQRICQSGEWEFPEKADLLA